MQSNVQQGAVVHPSGVDLSGMEDYLVELYDDSGTAKFRLPASNDAQALYVLQDGGDASGDNVSAIPLEGGKNYRIKTNGTADAGDVFCLADGEGVAGDKGKIRALPAVAGTYRGLGWFEEAAVDEQLALVRWSPQGNITVN